MDALEGATLERPLSSAVMSSFGEDAQARTGGGDGEADGDGYGDGYGDGDGYGGGYQTIKESK